ncbi:MAG: PilZ domain-containing protein [Chloroflexi bacterium]|nr:PilZ domain-containing protein [Chloroflexota bacterium]
MQERRRQPRKDLMSYSQVYDLQNGKLIGYLGDMNLIGAMVISDQSMEVNRELMISIQLPELPGIKDESIALPTRVVWCQKDISPEYFNVGLEFRVVAERQKAIIEAVMNNYEFRRQAPNYPPRRPEEIEE